MAELEHAARADDVMREAAKRHANVHLANGSSVSSKEQMLAVIAAVMDFPDYFGGNLDALYDCITDLSWFPPGEHLLLWTSSNALAQTDSAAYDSIRAVLSDAVDRMSKGERRLSVVLTDE